MGRERGEKRVLGSGFGGVHFPLDFGANNNVASSLFVLEMDSLLSGNKLWLVAVPVTAVVAAAVAFKFWRGSSKTERFVFLTSIPPYPPIFPKF